MVQEQTKARAIVRVPGVVGGEPILEGTRISVRSIVLYVYDYESKEDVADGLPPLTVADVESALQFYREHRDEINIYIAENNEGEDIPYDELHRL